MSKSPFFQRDGVTIYHGDCREVLRSLPENVVQTVVTSPPYWGLRDYGVAGQLGLERLPDCLGWATRNRCGACYVCRLTEVFRELQRILRDDGTLWINLGDGYAGYWGDHYAHQPFGKDRTPNASTPPNKPSLDFKNSSLKPKDLLGIPWRVALSLQADGWYLRASTIWSKPNSLPESAGDRPMKSHEYLLLLSKRPRYFYDAEAIKGIGDAARSVWTIPTRSYAGAHFAVFPHALIRPCLLAGTSAEGCCAECLAPYRRVVERNRIATRPGRTTKISGRSDQEIGHRDPQRHVTVTSTKGWKAGCRCEPERPRVPCTVLDPFLGSGTTAAVAQELGCRVIGIELNDAYCQLAADRFRQRHLFAASEQAS